MTKPNLSILEKEASERGLLLRIQVRRPLNTELGIWHAHIGSQIFEVQPHIDLAGVMADALKLAKEIGHPVVDLNLGGGLGIKYVQEDNPPSFQR